MYIVDPQTNVREGAMDLLSRLVKQLPASIVTYLPSVIERTRVRVVSVFKLCVSLL